MAMTRLRIAEYGLSGHNLKLVRPLFLLVHVPKKMCFVLSDVSLAKFTAKTCFDILKPRRNLFCTA